MMTHQAGDGEQWAGGVGGVGGWSGGGGGVCVWGGGRYSVVHHVVGPAAGCVVRWCEVV